MGEFADIFVCMYRPSLAGIPQFALPDGFSLSLFKPGQADDWLAVQQRAERIVRVTRKTFDDNFGHDLPAMADRSYFLLDAAGAPIGTATAWYDDSFHGRRAGRVHWVAVVPEFQGRGLAKPLMTAVMNRLARSHEAAYLITSTLRLAAIHLYLNFGFVPLVRDAKHPAAWEQVRRRLAHPMLDRPPLTPDMV